MSDLRHAIARQAALQLYDSGQLQAAVDLGEQAIRQNPRDAGVLLMLAAAMRTLGQLDAAAAHRRRCAALSPSDPAVQIELGRLRFSQGRFDEAVAAYDHALKLQPGMPQAIAGKAGLLEHSGDHAGAADLLRPLVDRGEEDDAMAVVYSRVLLARGEHERVLALVTRHLAGSAAAPLNRTHLTDAMARAHDALGRHREAFEAFQACNALQRIPFDLLAFVRGIDDLIALFSPPNLARMARSTKMSERPMFVASLPRSGSTLVEQIIHSHPEAFGAGETPALQEIVDGLPFRLKSIHSYPACIADLTPAAADRLHVEYLQKMTRLDRGAKRIVNKHLENYRHLGLVELLFPGSRIVHVRRDPMDNCFSCYTIPLQHAWSTDLRSIGAVYRQFERLMSHWREVLTVPILDVPYEELVADPERWIKRIIDFCGLPWDDRCLRYWEAKRNVLTLSYDQVNKPIYASAVKRWEKYEPYLGPLKEALAAG